eukprot:g37965.t1
MKLQHQGQRHAHAYSGSTRSRITRLRSRRFAGRGPSAREGDCAVASPCRLGARDKMATKGIGRMVNGAMGDITGSASRQHAQAVSRDYMSQPRL